MDGNFQTTARFQNLDILLEANQNVFEMHFECEFSPLRIQTLTWSHPCVSDI